MSFDYFLSSKKIYENILINFQDIIDNYQDLLTKNVSEYGCFHQEIDLYFSNHKQNIQTIVKLKLHVREQMNLCNEKMQSLCEHKFVDDSIDISPDTSQNIRYCEICEYTVK